MESRIDGPLLGRAARLWITRWRADSVHTLVMAA